MSKIFQPNERGVVVVTLLTAYGSNVAGERAGFLPEIAKALVKKGYAELPGQPAAKPTEAEQEGAEMTSRKFRPTLHPLDHDGDGKKGGSLPSAERAPAGSGQDKLRAQYKELTGNDADARWGDARLTAEIQKALDAAVEAASKNVDVAAE